MSKFFKALEQAERDRSRDTAPPEGVGSQRGLGPARVERAPSHAPRVVPPDGDRSRSPVPGDADVDSGFGEIDPHLVSLTDRTTFAAEQYRALRHIVEHLHTTAELRTLAVTSPGSGDGKTTTALNLAGALAQAPSAQVLLVEADLRRPTVVHRLGLPPGGPGLVDAILEDRLGLDDIVKRRPPLSLSVILAGGSPETSYEVLKSDRFRDLLAEARGRFDYVVLDTPPLVPLPDGRIIERLVDGVLLVVAAHRTPRKLVAEALTILDGSRLVGIVFNGDDRLESSYYGGYYSGYYRRFAAEHASERNDRPSNGHGPAWWRLGRWR